MKKNPPKKFIFDGDKIPEMKPIYGRLCGWSDKKGAWEVHIVNRNEIYIFRSSNKSSERTVCAAKRIIKIERFTNGEINQRVGFQGGVICFELDRFAENITTGGACTFRLGTIEENEGLETWEDVEKLFDLFYKKINEDQEMRGRL